jgi:hypothetical protein
MIRKFKWWLERKDLTWPGIKQGIKNLILWFVVVWHDRWWDHSFLYSILRHKLNQMEKKFKCCGVSARSKKDAKNMRICVLLLDRLINDDYFDYEDKRGWETKFRLSFEKEEQMINQDLDLLFKILRKQIRCWWD